LSAEQLLGSVITDQTVIADLEAGIGTLTRLPDGAIDVVVVVVEPTPRSLDVGVRARDLAVERKVGRVVIVANRVTGDDDRVRVTDLFGHDDVVLIPDDPQIIAAERHGQAPLDVAPASPAVRAIVALAADLT
jgi:CO dehydrogenase nickel-insertion accessory protein CooC1